MDFHIRCLRSFSDSKAGSIDGLVALETVQSSELLDKG
uniref:Uncharacterized protein n=1 Tax=Kalanchoe fedtschenkoi TaxID=63787 RepID=A0A7N0ZS24_KALFE